MTGLLLCLVNPASGRGRALRTAESLCKALNGAGHVVSLESSRGPGWIARRAAEVPGDTRALIAVGGDGTVNEAAQGLSGRGIPLAVFPTGTINLLARVYRLPSDVRGFLSMMEAWRIIPLDLGQVGERVFLSCAGAGFDADVIRRLHKGRRGAIRVWSYVPHVVSGLTAGTPPLMRLRLDGKDCGECGQVIVGNLPLYAGPFSFTPEARGDDGVLDVAIFRGRRRRDYLRYAVSAVAHRPRMFEDVEIRTATEVALESDGPVPLQLDGDMGGALPAVVRVQPGALRLLVPSRGILR